MNVFIVKTLVTAVFVAVVLWSIDLMHLASRLAGLSPHWLALSFGAVAAAIAVSAWKWGMILAARGHPMPFLRLVRHYFVGLFFNNLLPSTVGGDAIRAWETTRDTSEAPEAVASVVSERLIAGASLGLTAALGLPFTETGADLGAPVLLFLAINLTLVALFLVPSVAEGVVGKLLPNGFGASVLETVRAVRASGACGCVADPGLRRSPGPDQRSAQVPVSVRYQSAISSPVIQATPPWPLM